MVNPKIKHLLRRLFFSNTVYQSETGYFVIEEDLVPVTMKPELMLSLIDDKPLLKPYFGLIGHMDCEREMVYMMPLQNLQYFHRYWHK